MTAENRPTIRLGISFVRGVWVVTIFNGDKTENRSFRKEVDARAWGEARVEQLRSGGGEIRLNGKD